MATIADLEFRLAGGSGNTNPHASYGGAMSTVAGGLIASQTTTVSPAIVGISVTGAAGNTVGVGTLTYSATTQAATWRPFGGVAGTPIVISTSGVYVLPSGNGAGQITISVTASSLPSGDATASVTVSAVSNNLFDDISKFESNDGDTEYRTIYVRNKATVATVDLISSLKIYIASQTPGADVIEIGLDPAGKNGTAATPSLNVTAASWVGQVATVTLNDDHPHKVGDYIVIAGITPSGYNGTKVVTAVTATTVSYAVTSDPGSYTSGGTVVGEASVPVGVTFGSPSTADTGLPMGDLDAQDYYPVRVRRTIGSGTRVATPVNPFTLSVDALI